MFAIRRQTPPPPLSSVNFSRLFVYPIFSISIVFIFSLKNAQNLGLRQLKLEKFLFFEMFLFFLQKKTDSTVERSPFFSSIMLDYCSSRDKHSPTKQRPSAKKRTTYAGASFGNFTFFHCWCRVYQNKFTGSLIMCMQAWANLNMTRLLLFLKVERNGGLIFKTVLEC